MKVATSSFGPFDVLTLQEIVEHIDEYDDGAAIYVKAGETLKPSTPAAVTGQGMAGPELERELGFCYLADVDLAKEAVEDFGGVPEPRRLAELLELIEEYGM